MKAFLSKCIAALPLMLILYFSARADESREEAIFSFRYLNFSNDYTVFLDKDSTFIPLEEILSFLNIYFLLDENHTIKGYVNNADSSFVIDFQSKAYKNISGEEGKIENEQWFAGDLQIFLRSDVFCKIFNCDIKIFSRKLMLNLISKYEMPLQRASKVYSRVENFRKTEEAEEFGPMISDRTFMILNGGTFDYSLGATKGNRIEAYTLGSMLGLQVLGGEFQYQFNGNFQKTSYKYFDNIRWGYRIGYDYLQNIILGDIYQYSQRGGGSRGYRKPMAKIRGVQISNESMKMPNVFSHYIIEDYIESNWNIELYIDNQLYDVQKSDLNGYYKFEIPVSYGVTNISVKYYGLRGEFVSTEKVLNIPTELLVPGDIKYTLSGGYDDYSDKNMIDGSVSVGLTDWLTTTISGTKAESSGDYLIVGQSAINIFRNILLNVTATNHGVYEGYLRLSNKILGNYDLIYTHYDPNYRIYNSNKLGMLQFYTTFNNPLKLPFTISLVGNRSINEGSNTNQLNSSAYFFFGGISFMLRYGLSFHDISGIVGNLKHNLNLNTSYYISQLPTWLTFLGRIRFNVIADIIPSNWKLNNISCSFQQDFSYNMNLNLNYNYYPSSNLSNLRLSINFNMPEFRSATNIDRNNQGEMMYSGTMNGSVEFDSYNLRLNFLNSMGSNGMYGRSSAAIKFYRDLNYNNKYDEGDELIPDIDFNITNGYTSKTNTGGYKVLSNLMPGGVYNIKVKPESIPDPSMIPEYTEFSFVAEPYTYKSIEIAIQSGGIIEGNIAMATLSGKKGIGGAKIHIDGKENKLSKTVSVFSDGSFFYSGLPVGTYRVYIDDAQLKILNSNSIPEYYDIEVKPLSDGDFIGNLNFELLKGGTMPATELLVTESKKGDSPNITNNMLKLASNENTTSVAHGSDVMPDAKKVELPLVLFYTDSGITGIETDMLKSLNSLIDYLKTNPEARITITAALLIEDEQANKSASSKRSTAITKYITEQGIDRDRILSFGKNINDGSEYNLPAEALKKGIVEINTTK